MFVRTTGARGWRVALVLICAVLPQLVVSCNGQDFGIQLPDSLQVGVHCDGGCGHCGTGYCRPYYFPEYAYVDVYYD
ncbi:MAG: hypothetical protein JXA69_07000 [Phycisphaerae bacterium]|nr:hypothetical protein [Phycisphaerae bacterium]